jgi:hypothetical protein
MAGGARPLLFFSNSARGVLFSLSTTRGFAPQFSSTCHAMDPSPQKG